MSELINKYKEAHERMVDLLVEYYPLHELFLERQSPHRTAELRRVLKQLRITIKELEVVAQERMKERRVEWAEKHGRLNKENEE